MFFFIAPTCTEDRYANVLYNADKQIIVNTAQYV